MSVSIKDIAQIADVSTAAVSFALNNKPGVSRETAEKIRTIAIELGYPVPDPPKSSNSIHFVDICVKTDIFKDINPSEEPSFHLPGLFTSEYLAGVTTAAKTADYKVIYDTYSGNSIENMVKSLGSVSAVGLVILGAGLYRQDLLRFTSLRIPLVFIDVYDEFLEFDFVDIDNTHAVFQIINYLHEQGHERIGLVKSSVDTPNFTAREEAFLDSMNYFGLEVKEEDIITVPPSGNIPTSGMQSSFLNLLKSDNRPTALFCENDYIALGCMNELTKHNINVPEDLSIVGFDDMPLGTYSNPSLTTVNISKRDIGARAFSLLKERSEYGKALQPVKIRVSGKLVVRNSSGKAPRCP